LEMRYSVYSPDYEYTLKSVVSVGGKDIQAARNTRIVFATLSQSQVERLVSQGFIVRKVKRVSAPVTPPKPVAATPRFSLEEMVFATGIEELRRLMPLYGEGFNAAVVDTGIRESHEMVKDRVVYSKNYTSDPMEDKYDHGTGVASAVAAVVPKGGILNLKVLDSTGYGTEESVVMAIDDCILLRETEPAMARIAINLSLGSPDDGDSYNPIRTACREAIERGIYVIAAAGNDGPHQGTIISPACEEFVVAVGSCGYEPFVISEFSSRGPTKEGLTKPDMVTFGENIVVASSKNDTATTAKSGTSFSVPFITGLNILGGELRVKGPSYGLGVPEEVLARLMPPMSVAERFASLLHVLCVKPEGVLAGKDNDYGYGLPLANLAFKAMTEEIRGLTYVGLLEPVTSIVSIGLVSTVMRSLVKGVMGAMK